MNEPATVHDLKTWPTYLERVRSGAKTFELRDTSDRAFTVGDLLRLREWIPDPVTDGAGTYTGEVVLAEITDIVELVGRFTAFDPSPRGRSLEFAGKTAVLSFRMIEEPR